MTSENMLIHRVECGNATFDDHISLAQALISRGWAERMPTYWAAEAFAFSSVLSKKERSDYDMQSVHKEICDIKIKYSEDEIYCIEIEGNCRISVSDADGEQVYTTTKAVFQSTECRKDTL